MYIHPDDYRFAEKTIAFTLESAKFRMAIPPRERRDVTSELWCRLLEVWDEYNPSRASRHTYIRHVVTTQLISILRARRAQKRDGRPATLDHGAFALVDHRVDRAAERLDLRLDVQELLSHATPEDRRRFDRARRGDWMEDAVELRSLRTAQRRRREAVRRVFGTYGANE